ncbi:MAG: hypothetical protein GWN93_07490, partial [Deltaproteobacteria bacterium]|nr:hypothetical protein [Deltaproteobacteria bacterium]
VVYAEIDVGIKQVHIIGLVVGTGLVIISYLEKKMDPLGDITPHPDTGAA